jgi:His/Glu/Gln/Arg/opine family amino acid ABC transporter permease subunit
VTAAVATRSRFRMPVDHRVVLVAVFVAIASVLFATGALPAQRWAPFLLPGSWTFLALGLLVTIAIGGTALVASLAIGIPLGMARAALRGPVRVPVVLWIEAVRSTPILALLFIVYLGVSRIGIDLDWFQASVVALTIYTSAVLAEIVRAGIQSISRGEIEAARSLGLNYALTMRHVVLPQALSRMAPALVSQLITLVKDTSLAFIIGAQELMGFGRSFFVFYGNVLETYVVVACIFFVVCYTLSRIARRLELRQPAAERVVVTGEADQVATVTAVGSIPVASVGGPKAGS